jgi:alkyl hydroperoxide reductase subunit AhpC
MTKQRSPLTAAPSRHCNSFGTMSRCGMGIQMRTPRSVTLRGTFIIDPEGILRHMSVNELDVGRNVNETLRVLQALRTGELCPVD